jgi:hypothetical protein
MMLQFYLGKRSLVKGRYMRFAKARRPKCKKQFLKMVYAVTEFRCVVSTKVYSGAVVGVEAFEVEIELHAGWGTQSE